MKEKSNDIHLGMDVSKISKMVIYSKEVDPEENMDVHLVVRNVLVEVDVTENVIVVY